MRKIDYNIADLNPDDLYRLLPFKVRETDPNESIRVIFNALSSMHNFAVGKLREMPRLQDPDKAGKFSPSDFGESESDYLECLQLMQQDEVDGLTDGQKSYLSTLKLRLPQSLLARDKELQFLKLLSDTVGVKLFGRLLTGSLRSWVKTGVYRSHIAGTQSSILLLSRLLGFVDLKVAELWSRFALRDPGDPRATRNDPDFSYTPDEFPYAPQSGVYGSTPDLTRAYERTDGLGNGYNEEETLQLPYGSITYNPNVLDDADHTYVVVFENVSANPSSRLHFNLLVDNHNPFGNFIRVVNKRLAKGTYELSNGSVSGQAYVAIPSEDGLESFIFEAIAHGEWGNKISILVENIGVTESLCDPLVDLDAVEGQQRLTLSGPQSKIKFKTSLFDLVIGIDPVAFLFQYPAIPVRPNTGLREVGTFGYTIDILSNTLNASVDGDVSFVASGDELLITNSTSQIDSDGFEVDRNKRYSVNSVRRLGFQTDISLSLLPSENCTYDTRAFGHTLVDISSVSDDGSGNAYFHFNRSVSSANGADVSVVNSYSGVYDGRFSVRAYDNFSTSIKLYSDDTLSLIPYSAVPNNTGVVVFPGQGYRDGVIPLGYANPRFEVLTDSNGDSLVTSKGEYITFSGADEIDTSNGVLMKLYKSTVLDSSVATNPVLGSVDGHSQQSTSENYQINLKAYLEVLAMVRQLVADVTPMSRTVRREISGFAFNDQVPYAPVIASSSVVLRSGTGNRYRMSVSKELVVSWTLTSDAANTHPIIQKDVNGKCYEWRVSDKGAVFFKQVPFVDRNILVHFQPASDTERAAYVYLFNGILQTSHDVPAQALEQLHLKNSSEAYLENDLGLVVESIPAVIAKYMGAAASSTDKPSAGFEFMPSPEDDLSVSPVIRDFAQFHVSVPWLNDVKLEWVNGAIEPVTPITLNKDGFSEGLWGYYFNNASSSSNGEFHGQDPRLDSRGIDVSLIEPVPSGYLHENYPIAFLDHHNMVAWRDRLTGDAKVSSYDTSCTSLNEGPVRIDASLSYMDGPMEPSGSSRFSHQVEIEYPWKKMRSRVITPVNRDYSSLSNDGGRVQMVFPKTVDLTGVYIGTKVFFDAESSYTGVYQVISKGVNTLTISAPYTAPSSGLSGTFWMQSLELDLWESGSNNVTVSVEPVLSGLTSGQVSFATYVNFTSELDTSSEARALSGSCGFGESKSLVFDPTSITLIPATQQKRTVMACLKCGLGTFQTLLKLEQQASEGVLSNSVYGGSLAWSGGNRDQLVVTLLPPGETSALTFNEDDPQFINSSIITRVHSDNTVSETVGEKTIPIWRGGFFVKSNALFYDRVWDDSVIWNDGAMWLD